VRPRVLRALIAEEGKPTVVTEYLMGGDPSVPLGVYLGSHLNE
jgi:hypothetical protein